jgi:hypothetical protein
MQQILHQVGVDDLSHHTRWTGNLQPFYDGDAGADGEHDEDDGAHDDKNSTISVTESEQF